jgi:hypothetical protein
MSKFDFPKEDDRPKNGGWAPGDYFNKCFTCKETFIGDKRAIFCADCAYSSANTPAVGKSEA